MSLLSNFPGDDNGHLILIQSQLKGMKDGDKRHVEIDDRFSALFQADGGDRYTGWIYYANGAIPTLTFENATLKQIVADAYEQGLFTPETAGQLYNRFQVNQLESTVGEELEKQSTPVADDVGGHEFRDLTPIVPPTVDSSFVYTGEVVAADAPKVSIDQVDNRLIITIMKSVSHQLADAHPELTASEIFDLVKAKTDEWIGQKIKKLMDEGYEQKQAIAIAYSMAGKTKKAKESDKQKVEQIRSHLRELVNYHKKGDTDKVIQHHEKIDQELHSLVGKEGLTSMEKARGGQKAGHKYLRREGSPGNYQYIYDDKKREGSKKELTEQIKQNDEDKYIKNVDKYIKEARSNFKEPEDIVEDALNNSGIYMAMEKIEDRMQNQDREGREKSYKKLDELKEIENTLRNIIEKKVGK